MPYLPIFRILQLSFSLVLQKCSFVYLIGVGIYETYIDLGIAHIWPSNSLNIVKASIQSGTFTAQKREFLVCIYLSSERHSECRFTEWGSTRDGKIIPPVYKVRAEEL